MIFRSTSKDNNISIKIDELVVKDESKIANAFNKYFCSIAQELQDKIPNYGNYEDFVRGIPSSDSFFFKAVTHFEMLKTLNSINFNKSNGDFRK